MRFTKTDPQLGELVVETSSKAEALQLRASGYQQQDDDGAAAEEPAVPARRKDRAPAVRGPHRGRRARGVLTPLPLSARKVDTHG